MSVKDIVNNMVGVGGVIFPVNNNVRGMHLQNVVPYAREEALFLGKSRKNPVQNYRSILSNSTVLY